MEFLSGIRKEDRLIPVVMLVLYHGKGKWTAPDNLQEMLDLNGMDETLQSLHMNYQLKVVNLSELDEAHFETGLRELIGMMKRKDNKEAMRKYCRENEKRFRNMDDETYDLICTMIQHKELAVRKESCRNVGKETVDMCRAIEEMVEEGKIEGKKEGEKIGEERLGRLISRLFQDGRIEDAGKAAKSIRTRRRLYQEYNI